MQYMPCIAEVASEPVLPVKPIAVAGCSVPVHTDPAVLADEAQQRFQRAQSAASVLATSAGHEHAQQALDTVAIVLQARSTL